MPRFERSMNWEFLGNQNDWGGGAAGEAAGVPGGGAEQLPGSRSPLSNELGSLLGEIHWKNSKTEGIQEAEGYKSEKNLKKNMEKSDFCGSCLP